MKKRLSWFRVCLAFLLLTGGGYGGYRYWHQQQDGKSTLGLKPWFASYVDVTARPSFAFEQLGETSTPHVVMSFIVSSPSDPCLPSWGIGYPLDKAAVDLDLDRRVARLRQQGGEVAVSFGGLLNDELAVKCTDESALRRAYTDVIDRYTVDTIDLDLEGQGLTDLEAAGRRARVLSTLQQDRRNAGKSLAVWLTVPVAPQGMTADGINAVQALLKGGVDLAGVNVMTMDYKDSKSSADSMAAASGKALMETHRQLGILYQQAGISLSSGTVWAKIGATPMIGQNDVPDEVFTKDDAVEFNKFALAQGVIRLSMWSANRDIQCGENYVDTKIVSDSCSGVKQDKHGFADILSAGFTSNMSQNAGNVTVEDADAAAPQTDDPAHSPYQIWQETGAYLEGTKIVWHRNVYQAKWWTQGDIPDNPVLQSWQTPWQLIGPVLPGETPIPQPTLADGTYPKWDGETVYDEGDRVLFNSVPYQAKWWTQGDSPAAASSNADGSPWVPLTAEQVAAVIAGQEATPSAKPRRPSPRPSPSETPSSTPVPSSV